ncbi:MAG: NAD(P)/FAD-dependent oxidoreductase [Kofleriaceae bacterium]
MRDVDLVIVGGGPAGLSTALHLHAIAPHLRIVILERETYPREKICAGGIGARAFKLLAKIRVEVECPKVPLTSLAVRLAHDTIVTTVDDLGVVVRRIEFDHALAKVAIARGIELRDGCGVSRIEFVDESDRALGANAPRARGGDREDAERARLATAAHEAARVRVTTASGDVYRARAIVGADGVSGVVRNQAGFARPELRAQVVELDTEGVADDLPRDTVVFDFARRDLAGYAWDFPTIVDGQPLVCRGAYVIRTLGADDARKRCAAYLAERGLDIQRYRIKQFAERGWQPGAEIACPRVLLVGEAAGIDIATGEGIGQAIEYGAVAGPYLARAFERDNLRFGDWRTAVEKHHLGFQLRIRHLAYELFYGRRRAKVEFLMPRLTSMFRVAIQDFAGVPMSKLALARGAGQFLAAYAKMKMRPEDVQ